MGSGAREFPRAETVKFLRDMVPQLAQAGDADVDRLASVQGELPLAAEHAAAYLLQMGTPVAEYIAAFERNAHELFAQEADMYATSRVVSTTWSVTPHLLSPKALELFEHRHAARHRHGRPAQGMFTAVAKPAADR